MKLLFIFIMGLSIQGFAQESLNTKFPRVMNCQIPTPGLFFEVYHDQSGTFGAPVNPTGYLVIWGTVMGKDTQKRLVLDVQMKQTGGGSNCILEMKWTQKNYDKNAISSMVVDIEACNFLSMETKGKITQEDVYQDGKKQTSVADVNCKLQK
jgi:hypothetical protein